MSDIRIPQNPGIARLDEFTTQEQTFIQNLAGLPYASGDILYHNGTSLTRLPKGTDGEVLKLVTGLPSWETDSTSIAIGDTITSATAGSILFAGTAGVLAQDNTGLFWDNTNDRLGIGTTGPSEAITINSYGVGRGLAFAPYLRLGNTDASRMPFISFNARLSNSTGLNEFTPIAYDASSRAMGILRTNAGQAGLRYDAYINGTTGTAVNLNSFTNLFTISDSSSTLGYIGLGTTSPTHTLTLPSTSTGIALYNTADQVTNYERVTHLWNSNVYSIKADNLGTGTARAIQLISAPASAASASLTVNANATNQVDITRTSSVTGKVYLGINGTCTQSSSTVTFQNIGPVINQSGTAGYTGLLINPTETATGSGTKRLISAKVGGVDRFAVDNVGSLTLNNASGRLGIRLEHEDNFDVTNESGARILGNDGVNRTLRLLTANDTYIKGEIEVENNNTSSGTIYLKTSDSTFDAVPRLTISGSGTTTLTKNSNSASVQVLVLEGDRATPATNDEIYQSFIMSDSAENQDEFARIIAQATDATSTSEDGQLKFAVMNAGSLTTVAQLNATSFNPNTNDARSLGTSTLSWSDLFLASGGVINWANGNATLTHSTGALTSSVDVSVPDEAYGAGWNGSTEVPTKNAIYDKIETLGAGGTVTDVSVASANGFAGTVATSTTTPAITLSTSVTGLLKGNGTAISAATSGTDYSAGTSALATGILKSTTTTGALSIAVAGDFPTLNQDTTGNAASTNAIKSATTTVNVSSATAPTSGQVLTATSGTAATWQDPSSTSSTDEIPVTLGESIDGTTTPKAVFIADGNTTDKQIIGQDISIAGQQNIYQTRQLAFIFNSGLYDRLTSIRWESLTTGIGVDDNLYIEIYAVDGSNLPTGSALASKTFNSTSFSGTNGSVCTFDTPVTVSKSTNYACVARASTSDSGDFYEFNRASTNPTSQFVTTNKTNIGAGWVDAGSYPADAYVRGYEALTEGKAYISNDETTPQRNAFNGFIYTSGVADDVEYMRVNYSDGFSGLTLGSRYYISTSGSISTTGDIEVGRALSTTELNLIKEPLGSDVDTLLSVSNSTETLDYTFTATGFVFGHIKEGASFVSIDITVGGITIGLDASLASENNSFCIPVKSGDRVVVSGDGDKYIYFRTLN